MYGAASGCLGICGTGGDSHERRQIALVIWRRSGFLYARADALAEDFG